MTRTRRKLSPRSVIGIDPGSASGGIAIVHSTGDGEVWKISNMTPQDMHHKIKELSYKASIAVIEKVHAMPRQGVSSTFKFGKNLGHLEMALISVGIPYFFVPPKKWQQSMSCLTKGDKNVSKAAAQRLFPNIKMTHAFADALLIAEYGRRFLND